MTEEEKIIKKCTALSDIKTLNDLLDRKSLNNAENTINKIRFNVDYTKEIEKSMINHKVPAGKMPFGSLEYQHQRKIVIMLRDAVKNYLVSLEEKSTE